MLQVKMLLVADISYNTEIQTIIVLNLNETQKLLVMNT